MICFIVFLLLLIIAYLYLSMPARREIDRSTFFNWDYAHRGFHDNSGPAPENSLLAIELAVDNKYGMEFDIRLSKDGQVILFHDDDLKRMTNRTDHVRNLDFAELNQIKLLDSDQTIPLFSEVLELVDGKVPIIVELKCPNEDVEELASKASQSLDSYEGVFMVESFNPFAVKWFRDNRPNYIRGQLSSGHFPGLAFRDNFLMKKLLVNYLSRPDFIAYEHKYRNKFALWIQKHIWKSLMVCYTVKVKEDYGINKPVFDLIIFEGFKP